MGGFTEGITGERSHRLVGSLMFLFYLLVGSLIDVFSCLVGSLMDGVTGRMPHWWVVSLMGGLVDERTDCYEVLQIGGLIDGQTNLSLSSFRPPLCTPCKNQLIMQLIGAVVCSAAVRKCLFNIPLFCFKCF